ncbi:MAG: BatD family protein [Bdellovibrio bacteriovorus]
MSDRATHAARPLLVALLLFCCVDAVWAQVRVEAHLASQELSSPQPVELTLSAVSADGPLASPDLSVLDTDFQILDRRVERRASTINGQRREELRLRLMLLPRRAGELELPGIPFGSARSEPLRLSVGGEGPGATTPAAFPSSAVPEPEGSEPAGDTMSGAHPLGWYPDWTSGLLSSPPPAPAPLPTPLSDPGLEALSYRPPQPAVPPAAPRAPAQTADAETGTFDNPWFWVSLALAAILAGVLRRRRRPAGAARADRAAGSLVEEAPAPDPLESAVEVVRAAYQRGDGRGAREALLNWGRLRWPQDPPGNLARLAGRCPSPLRDHITELEKAFFSPDPIHWERDPVPDEISAQSPPRVEGAAA